MFPGRARRCISHVILLCVSSSLLVSINAPTPSQAQTPTSSPQSSSTTDEIESLRTKYSKVYAEPDGTRTAKIYTTPIHFEADDGTWKDIDNTLVPQPDGTGYENKAGALDIDFADSGGRPSVVEVADGSLQLGLGLEAARSTVPVVDANKITYPDIYPNVDLTFEVVGEQVKELLVLKQPPRIDGGRLEFRFPLTTKGLTAERTSDGQIRLLDSTGNTVFTIPKLYMYDSYSNPQSAEPALSEDIDITPEQSGGKQFLAVSVDGAWLTDPARVYPVFIDPSITKTPSLDTFVQSNIENTPQSDSDELKAGYYTGPDGTFTARSLLHFDLSSVPSGSDINSAKLSLFEKHSYSCDPRHVEVYRVTDKWGSGVTWPNKPGFAAEPADTLNVAKGYSSACPGGRINFDVRSIVKFWKNSDANNDGFGIRARNEDDKYGWKKFASDQATHKPELTVKFDEPNNPPGVPNDLSPPDDTFAPDATPVLKARYRDPDDGDRGRVDFKLLQGGDVVATHTSDNEDPGTLVSWTTPSLKEGLTYKWQARNDDGDLVSDWTTLRSYTVDQTSPPAPDVSSSTHPNQDTWYANNDPAVAWSASDPAGISGYNYALNSDPDYALATTVRDSQTQMSWTDLSDGERWFHVRAKDGAGNWGPTARFRIRIDAVGPSAAISSSTHPDQNKWYASDDPSFSWEASDLSGVCGYSYELDQNATTTANTTSEGTGTTKSYSNVGQGTFYFHLRAKNCAGAWGPTSHFRIQIDSYGPATTVSSSTHPEQNQWYQSDDPKLSWSASASSGISGYSYILDNNTATTPDDISEGTGTTKSYTDIGEGTHYFHVRARNGAGVWGGPAHFRIQVDYTPPPAPAVVTSTSHVPHVEMRDNTIDVTWSEVTEDNLSGVKEYWWAFRREGPDGDKGPAPDNSNKSLRGDPNAQSAPLDDGRYWFHVVTVDNAGNVSKDHVVGPFIVNQNGSPVPLTPTLDQALVAQSDTNGMEQFYPYSSTSFGTATGYVNLHSGNLVAKQPDVTVPAQGLNAAITHTYNSQRSDPAYHDTGVGRGWTLSLADANAGLDFAGSALEIDLNSAVVTTDIVDAAGGAIGRVLELTDGDGTVHRFVRKSSEPGTRWQAPPGVDLKVLEVVDQTSGVVTEYRLIRPDGVVYVVDQPKEFRTTDGVDLPATPWHVVAIEDRKGNRLELTYTRPTDITSLQKVRVSEVRHQPDGELLAKFHWDASGDLTRMVSLPGHTAQDPATGQSRSYARDISFAIDPQTRLLQQVTTNSHLPEGPQDRQTTKYGYSDSQELNVDFDQDPPVVTSVTDPRGNTTGLGYSEASGTLRLVKIKDRAGQLWGYDYRAADPNSGERTTVATTPGPSGATSYRISGRKQISDSDERVAGGNILKITDAGNNSGAVTKSYEWKENHLITKTDGVGNATRMEYNDLGLVTKLTTPPPNDPQRSDLHPDAPTEPIVTTLGYRFPEKYRYGADKCSDPASSSGPISKDGWCYAVAELIKTTRAANLSARSRVTDFSYDGEGNLASIIERGKTQADRTTTFDYYNYGALKKVDGPRTEVSDVTLFGDSSDPDYGGYHRSGQPHRIEDASGKAINVAYNPYGAVGKLTDRAGRVTTTRYDELDRVIEDKDPAGDSATYSYDPNGNKASETSPRGNATATTGDFTTRYRYDPTDRMIEISEPGATESSARRISTTAYHPDGTKKSETTPVGATTTYAYYPNQQLKRTTVPAGTGESALTDYSYDAAGRATKVTLPQANAAGARPVKTATYTPSGVESTMTETSASGAADRQRKASYNAHGELLELLGPRKKDGVWASQRQSYDAFGQIRLIQTRAGGSKWLAYSYDYDLAGNKVAVTQPTGAGDKLTATYSYDKLNRLAAQTKDPTNPGHTVTYSYLPEGQQQTRVDLKDGVAQRTVRHTYNLDYTERSAIAVDNSKTGNPTVASCNWAAGADQSSGYDPDGNLLVTRTVIGSSGCDSGDTVRTRRLTYDHRGFADEVTQVIDLPNAEPVTRKQSLTYRADGVLSSSTWDGHTTTYEHSPAGLMESASDWRASSAASTFDYLPSGALEGISFPGAAQASFGYHSDGSLSSLSWDKPSGGLIRSHTSIDYDVGGLLTSESVEITRPGGSLGDTGGAASFDYDLAGRLVSWTSPFRLLKDEASTDNPVTTYGLDDAGNITSETVTIDGATKKTTTASFTHNRLNSRTVKTSDLIPGADSTTTDQGFSYSGLGEETKRTSRTTAAGIEVESSSILTSYDPGGRADEVDNQGDAPKTDIDYLYDASGQVIARTTTPEAGDPKTRLYFYFGTSTKLAEEASKSGATKTRYFNASDGQPLAEQRYKDGLTGGEPDSSSSSWVWLLRDSRGNVATELKDDGTIASQRAYDPYGAPNEGGTATATGEKESTLGFQAAQTDDVSGNLLLGPRIYDPTTDRFTTADTFVGSGSDMALGTDPLTGNRYLFAAANPVAFYDDGHSPSMCDGTAYCAPKESGGSGGKSRGGNTSSGGSTQPRPRGEYAGEVDEDWLVTFSGVRADEGSGVGFTWVDGISINFVHSLARVKPSGPGSYHLTAEAEFTFDTWSIHDVMQQQTGVHSRDISLAVAMCGTGGECTRLPMSPQRLQDCVGRECGRYVTMRFTGHAEYSESYGRPESVIAGATVNPPGSLGPFQVPRFRTLEIPLYRVNTEP